MPEKNPQRRWWTDNYLEFTLPLIESGAGLACTKMTAARAPRDILVSTGKMVARAAVKQADWKLPAYRPVYVILTINMVEKQNFTAEERAWLKTLPVKNRILSSRTPSVHTVLHLLMQILVGTVITKSKQVIGTMILKKKSKADNFLEVFVGAPTDWAELNHDIRNG